MKLNQQYLSTVKSCVQIDLPKNAGIFQKIGRVFSSFGFFVKRLFYILRYGEWLNNLKARKVVKQYIWDAAPGDKQAKCDQEVHGIFNKLQQCKRGQGNYSDGIDSVWISEKFDESDTQVFRRVKQLKAIDTRTLFHIQADEFGANNSSLEGHQSKLTLSYLNRFLQQRKEAGLSLYGLSDALASEVSEAVTLESSSNYVKDAKKKVEEAFEKKNNILLAGGWVGDPSGHAMFYEIIPTNDGQATFRLYNLGAGSSNHIHGRLGYKEKALPYYDFKGVKKSRLTDEDVLKALREMRTYKQLPDSDTKTDYGEVDIYHGLKALLNPTSVDCDEADFDIEALKTTQRSGVCAWKSLMAFLAVRLDKDEYKKFVCDVKLQSLSDRVSKLANTRVNQVDWRIINKSHRKISRKITKEYNRGNIGKKYLSQAQYSLRKVELWLERNREQALSQYRINTDLTGRAWENRFVDDDQISSKNTSLAYEVAHADKMSSMQPNSSIEQRFRGFYDVLKKVEPKDVPKVIATLNRDAQKALDNGEFTALDLGMYEFVKSIPLDFWGDLIKNDPKLAEKTIVELSKLSKILFENSFRVPHSQAIFTERRYVMKKLFDGIRSLSVVVNPSSNWKDLQLVFPMGQASIFHESNDPQVRSELAALGKQSYLIGCDMSYNFSSYEDVGESSHINFNGEHRYEQILLESFPEAKDKIAEEDSEFYSYSSAKQLSLLFTSEHLPEWFRGVRDSQFYIQHIEKEPVANPPTKKLDVSLRFNVKTFEGHDGRETCYVYVNVKGIDGKLLQEYPELKEVREKPNYRYEATHRRIQKKELRQCVKYLMEYHRDGEKHLLADHAKKQKIAMSDESFKELLHFLVSSEHYIPEAIEYFTKYPEKIRDPDYQVFFELILFHEGRRVNASLEEMLREKGFSNLLGNYFQREVKRAIGENSLTTAVYFLRLSRLCSAFAPDEPLFHGSIEKLRELLSHRGLEPGVKSVVYAELVASLGKKDSLNDRDLEDILVGSAFVRENPISEKWTVPQTRKEVSETFHRHSGKIEKYLGKSGRVNNSAINKVYRAVRSDQDLRWKIVKKPGEFPSYVSVDGKHKYCPQISSIITLDARVNIPEDILTNPNFKQVCPDVKEGIQKLDGIYEVTSPEGHRTLVKLHRGQVTIDQLREGKWYRFISPRAFTWVRELTEEEKKLGVTQNPSDETSLISRHLLESCTHWQSMDNSSVIKLCDKETGEFTHEADYRGKKIRSVRKIGENKWLGKARKILEHFEHTPYIHQWYTKFGLMHRLKGLELPRFGLSFTPDPRNPNKLYCDQFNDEGFFISENQRHPALGSYHHALVLENGKGDIKILLAKQKLVGPEDKDSIVPIFKTDKNAAEEKSEKQEYLVYDIDESGEATTSSRMGNIYLAYALTASHEYERAERVLRKYATKLSAYTEDEASFLYSLAELEKETGDTDGNAHGIRFYAQSMLLRNMVQSQRRVNKKFLKLHIDNYKKFLAHYHNVTAVKMKKEEELFVLKYLLNEKYDAQLFLRLQELAPDYAKEYKVPVQKQKLEWAVELPEFRNELRDAPFLRDDLEKVLKQNRKSVNLEKILITRAPADFSKKFYAFYDIAKNGSAQQKKWLKEATAFTSHPSQPGSLWAILLSVILENPEKFPAAPEVGDDRYGRYTRVRESWQKVLSIAAGLAGEKIRELAAHGESKNQPRDFTPKGFALDVPEAPTPNVSVLYGFKDGVSFKSRCEKEKVFGKIIAKKSNGGNLNNFLEWEKDNPVSIEPMYAKECERLIDDLAVHKANSTEELFSLSESGTEKVRMLLLSGKDEAEKQIQALKIEILELANKLPTQADAAALWKLSVSGKLDKPLTIEELLVSFARNQPEALKKRNSVLSETEINQIFDKMGEFLILSTQEQQRARAQNTFDQLQKSEDEQEKQDLIQQLAVDLLSTRHYVPAEKPAYLVFEYYANILMRKMQVDKLEKFLENGDTSPVMEMIMGSGKSKVLLPILGLLRADGEALSTLIVPHALFESVSSDTHRILDDAFSQSLKAFHFDRNTVFTEMSLEMILSDLKTIQKNRECVIMTSKSLQCFILKYIEKCDHYLKEGEYPKELQLMQEVIVLLSSAGVPLIDEADSVLNILHEVCFSTGDQRIPDRLETQVVASIYDILYGDSEVKAQARLESDPKPNKKAPVLTEELYEHKVKPLLAAKFIEQMKTVSFDSRGDTEKVQEFFTGLSKAQTKLVVDYLTHDEYNKRKAQAFYDRQDDCIKDVLALAGEQISEFLSHTLTRVCDEKYGLDLDNQVVVSIPYSAANTPSVGSQFANPYITMNYTYQYYSKRGVEEGVVLQVWKQLQSEAIKELKESDEAITLEDTKAWKQFIDLCGTTDIPLFNYKPYHVKRVVKTINSDNKRVEKFVRDCILPQLELYSKKLSCNPHNLIELFGKVSGFTGTLWNSKSMHRKITAEPEAGTDAKTIQLLWKNSRDDVHIIDEGSPDKMLEQLETAGMQYDMISDAGGYFKEGGNKNVAELLAKKKKLPVVYYNRKNEQVILENGKEILLRESKVSIDKRVTFLDQSHTTGADVKQKRNAVGVVTISRKMLLRDLLQSVWRLRGLAKSQRVSFVMTKEVEMIIRQATGNKRRKIRFDDILRFCIINQTKQQGKDNFKALRQELANVPQALLIRVLISDTFSVEQKKQAFEVLSGEWIKPACKPPSKVYGTLTYKEDSEIVLAGEKQRLLDQIDDIFQELPFLEENGIFRQSEKDTVNEIVTRMEGSLSAKVNVPLRDMDDDQTVEIEQETQTETETELEVQEHKEDADVVLGEVRSYSSRFKKFNSLNSEIFSGYFSGTPCFDLKTYLLQDEKLKKFANAFEGIAITTNVLEWPEKDPRVSDLKLLGEHRTPFHFVKIQDDGEVIVLNERDAGCQSADSLYNLTLGYYDSSKTVSDDVLRKIVKIKFLDGQSSYSKKELAFLKEWIAEQGAEEMQRFFQNEILAGYPDKATAYCGSSLNRLFKEVMAEERVA